VDQPGADEIPGGVRPAVQGDAEFRQLGQLVGHGGRDDVDVRLGVDERPGASGRDRTAAHHDDETAGQVDGEGIGQAHGSPPAMPAATVAPLASSMRRKAPVRRFAA
jgi:hypothetical protein